jgi:hypothetical protein
MVRLSKSQPHQFIVFLAAWLEEKASRQASKSSVSMSLLNCETVKVAVATGAYQIVLAATSRAMCTIPRSWILAAAGSIKMANVGGAFVIACPVIAGMVAPIIDGTAIKSRSSQDVMLVWSVSAAFEHVSIFIYGIGFSEVHEF